MDLDIFLADLAARFDEARRDERHSDARELAELERTDVTLVSRLLGCVDRPVSLILRGGERVTGTINDAADTWALISRSGGDVLIPLHAIVAVCHCQQARQTRLMLSIS
ncbi:MAG: hypothetical protein CSA82_02830 [Actinobacteria bacterium]|nr:MAG: hypothetical protein CSA82_02830 [Actinomycetota bacterium]